MKPKKYKVRLLEKDRNEMEQLTKRGKHPASIIKRANILLNLDETSGPVQEQTEIARQLSTSTSTIYITSKNYVSFIWLFRVNLKTHKVPKVC